MQPLYAQHDSTHLDLGYLTLNKAFTQQITIRGADLEKMPFSDLSTAIAAWAYGAYSKPGILQYVVDGNPVTDVNAYSIHDIEEVVIVENAAATIGTAPGQGELVLIRTKRGRGPGGFCASAQTGVVGATGSEYTTTTALFHNYYVSGYRNLGKVSFGGSANFIRDVQPYANGDQTVVTPPGNDRWRLNGYLDWRPDDQNRIALTMNYTPQTQKENLDSTAQGGSEFDQVEAHQHFVLPHLEWEGHWAKGLINDLQGTYLHSNFSQSSLSVVSQQPNSGSLYFSVATKNYHLWFRDRLSYAATAGNWVIRPELNVSYEHYSDQQRVFEFYNGGAAQVESLIKNSVFLVTPELDINYGQALDIVAGAMTHPGGKMSLTNNGREVYPFGSVTLDLLRLGRDAAAGADAAGSDAAGSDAAGSAAAGSAASVGSGTRGIGTGGASLKLFVSAASRAEPSNESYMLAGLEYPQPFLSLSPIFTGSSGGLPPAPGGNLAPPNYWIWEAGATYVGWHGRFQASYTFERRIATANGLIYSGSGQPDYVLPTWTATLHHADIRVKVIDAGPVRWQVGLNLTMLRSKMDPADSFTWYSDAGDIAPDPWSVTGGWVNRLQVKDFTAGLDLLYHTGVMTQSGGIYGRHTVIYIPHLYAGYRFHLPQNRSLEVFAALAGFGSKDAVYGDGPMSDGRQFYTIGANFCL